MAPTSQLWHGGENVALAEAYRPRTAAGVMECFSSWQPCLYHPIDRLAAEHWPSAHLDERWKPGDDVVVLLEKVYGFINRSDYTGASLPESALKVPAGYLDTDARRT